MQPQHPTIYTDAAPSSGVRRKLKVELPRSTKGKVGWTTAEDAAVLEMRDRRESFMAIGSAIGRSERACASRFETLDAERAWQMLDERRFG